ncbi:TPA: hypothetical protein HA243_05460 [Candidatus Micrarchaeota archaeon]|nr:hypothetical protein [Candidatus Micrarchaeota archaeon]
MVSPFKLIGYILQIAGMLIMFFGFFMLILDIQKVVSRVSSDVSSQSGTLGRPPSCDPKADELCGIDMTQEGATEKVFSKKIYNFLFYLGIGLFIMILGVIFRSMEEISTALSGLKKKDEKVRVPVGTWYGPKGRGPISR